MNANEKIFVSSYHAVSEEDDYSNGIVLNGSTSFWTNHDLPVEGNFATPEEALKAVCEANGYHFNFADWENDPVADGDHGRFNTDFAVDENNCEATHGEIEAWKAGQRKLWDCHISVWLKIRYIRDLTEAEAKMGKED